MREVYIMKLFSANEYTNRNLVFSDTKCMLVGMNWNEKAQRLLRHKKIKQKSLMDVFDVKTPGAVSHYLTGARQPDPMQIKALADRMNCSIDEFFIDDGEVAKEQVYKSLRAADSVIASSERELTQDDKTTIYRAAFSAGLDINVSQERLTEYIRAIVGK